MDRIQIQGINMVKTSIGGWSCFNCGASIDCGDYMTDCADCGAVFCRKCVEDESFTAHVCEEDED